MGNKKNIFLIILINSALLACTENSIANNCDNTGNNNSNYDVKIDRNINKFISSNDISLNADISNIVKRYVSSVAYTHKIILKNNLQDDNALFDYSGYLKNYSKFNNYDSSILSYSRVDGGSGFYFESDNFIPMKNFTWIGFKEKISDQIYLASGKKIEVDFLNMELSNLINNKNYKDKCLSDSEDIVNEFNFSNFHIIILVKPAFQNKSNEFGSIYYKLYITKITDAKYKDSFY